MSGALDWARNRIKHVEIYVILGQTARFTCQIELLVCTSRHTFWRLAAHLSRAMSRLFIAAWCAVDVDRKRGFQNYCMCMVQQYGNNFKSWHTSRGFFSL